MRAFDELIDLLRVRRLRGGRYSGDNPRDSLPFVFGGLVAAQALAAAGAGVPTGREVHSLHAYFVRRGDPTRPLTYRVEKVRDGRSFSLRRVVADQGDDPVFVMAASFQRPETGLAHQSSAMPAVPRPAEVPTLDSWIAPYRDRLPRWWSREQPIDLRFIAEPPLTTAERRTEPPQQMLWMKAPGEVPADPLLHACLVVYASDLTLLDAVVLAQGLPWYDEHPPRSASLDHAMWFHRPVRMDDWLLYVQESPVMTGVRGLARGSIFDRDGALTVSVTQEGLVRPTGPVPA